jgi:hypothetical protein
LFAVGVALGGTLLGRDGDLFLHLAYGRHVLAHGFHAPDTTLFTSTLPPVLHEWGAEVLLALLVQAFGLAGPLLVVIAVWATLPAWTFRREVQIHGFWPALGAAGVVLVGVGSSFTVRPHVVSWVLFLVLLHLPRARTWLAVPLTVVWVNLHGGAAVLVPVVLGAILAGETVATRRPPALRDLAVVAGTVLALLANPDGLGLWTHLVRFAMLGALNPAHDMLPPDLVTGTAVTFVAITVFALSGARDATWPERAVLLVTGVLAAAAMRNLPFYGLAAALFATRGFAERLEAVRASSWRLARELELEQPAGFAVAGALAAVGSVWFAVVPPLPSGPSVPTGAMVWLRAHPEVARSRGYAGYDYSGYLLYGTPVDRVYLHALNANIPLSLMEELAVLTSGSPDGLALLEQRGVAWVLVRSVEPLGPLVASAGWTPAYTGGGAVLYTAPTSGR